MKQAITLFLFIGSFFPSQSQPLYRYTFQEPHMGTHFKIIMYADDRQKAILTAKEAYDTVEVLNQILSDYIPESEVNQLNDSPAGEKISISNELYAAIDESLEISKLTGGAFDITVGSVVRLWREARKEKTLPEKQALEDALSSVGYKNIKLEDGSLIKKFEETRLDFGGIGKGMALSAAMHVINRAGITSVLIDAGGDILLGDPPPGKDGWEVIIGLFEQEEKFKTKLTIANVAVASSGDLYQFVEIEGKRYSHIVDPVTGLGVTGQKRSTVAGPDAAIADALASALCVKSGKEGKKLMKEFPNYKAMVFSVNAKNRTKVLMGKNLLK